MALRRYNIMYKTSIGDFYFLNPFVDNKEDYDKYFKSDKKQNKYEDNDNDSDIKQLILDILDTLYNEYYDDEDDNYDEDKDDEIDEKEPDVPVDKLPQKKINFDYKKTEKENNNKIKVTKAEALYLLGLDEDKYEIE